MSVAAIVQQRGGGVVRNRHASMPTWTSGGGRWGGRGRPGTGNCPAAGTRADGRGHNGLGRTRQRRVRGRGSHRPAARASADRASEPPGGNRRPSRDSAALPRSRWRRCRRQGSCGWTDAARGGQGRGHRAGDLAARAFGNGTSRRNYEYYCQILTIPL